MNITPRKMTDQENFVRVRLSNVTRLLRQAAPNSIEHYQLSFEVRRMNDALHTHICPIITIRASRIHPSQGTWNIYHESEAYYG